MKHLIVSLLAAIIIAPVIYGQEDEIRPHELGVSFDLFDFKTAELIRTTSLNAVIRDKKFGDEKSPGIGLHYFKGLKKRIDFGASLNAAHLNQPLPGKTAAEGVRGGVERRGVAPPQGIQPGRRDPPRSRERSPGWAAL
jgi:hypothetical protein